jgi:hypothetical protein
MRRLMVALVATAARPATAAVRLSRSASLVGVWQANRLCPLAPSRSPEQPQASLAIAGHGTAHGDGAMAIPAR